MVERRARGLARTRDLRQPSRIKGRLAVRGGLMPRSSAPYNGAMIRFRVATLLGVFGAGLAALAAPARADVAIVLNRAADAVDFATADRLPHRLATGELTPLPFHLDQVIVFRSGREYVARRIQANRMYFFADAVGGVELRRIGLANDTAEDDVLPAGLPFDPLSSAPVGATGPATPGDAAPDPGPRVTIPVKILVDDNDPATRPAWEKRIRHRIEAANEILRRTCFVELQVVAVDEWRSREGETDFDRALQEFEREVSPAPARLAIGFTSQFKLPRGLTHLGGTRAMLHTHLLMREWSQVASESERLEILLHELGHFLGAAHSPEPESVMRSLLADRKSRSASFRIRFDPLNALAMSLVAQELSRDVRLRPPDISLPTQFELCKVYSEVERALPDDPAAVQMERLLENVGMVPKLAAAEWVLRSVVAAAEENARRPSTVSLDSGARRLEGDALTEYYVNRAAAAARRAPPKLALSGFTLGLAVALDRTNLLRTHPLVGPIYERLETPEARRRRLDALGEPTALGRADLAQHFWVSAGLANLVGPLLAESIGLYKETLDSHGAEGFSLVDYQADLAGIALCEALEAGKRPLPDPTRPFVWREFLPAADELPEGLSGAQFASRYGSLFDRRFLAERQGIRRRIEQLPAYAAPSGP